MLLLLLELASGSLLRFARCHDIVEMLLAFEMLNVLTLAVELKLAHKAVDRTAFIWRVTK